MPILVADSAITQLFNIFMLFPYISTYHYQIRKSVGTLQRQNAENLKKKIPRKGISGPQSQFPHSCDCERIIYYRDGSAFSAGGNMWTDPGTIQIAHRHMYVETGAEAAQFPEKEFIGGFAVAV